MKKVIAFIGMGLLALAVATFAFKSLYPDVWNKLLGRPWMWYMIWKMEASQKQKNTISANDSSEYKAIIDQLESQFDSFKSRIPIEPKKDEEEFAQYAEDLSKAIDPALVKKMQQDNLSQVMFISNSHLLASFDYATNKGRVLGAGVFSYKKANPFSSNYTFSFIKPVEWPYMSIRQWHELLGEFGATSYDLPNFDKKAYALGGIPFMLKMMERPLPKDIAQSYVWNEVSENPFIMGLDEEKPDQDRSIYFGFYKDRYAFFMTSPFIREKRKLADNEGIIVVIDGKGESKFSGRFAGITNQHYLISFPDDELIDFTSYGWNPDAFMLTVRMSYTGDGERGIVDRKIDIDTKELRAELGESQWSMNLNGTKMQLEDVTY